MSHIEHQKSELSDWLSSRTGVCAIIAVSVLGFLIYTGHSAHLLGALPYLLILACPLSHMFMHGGHHHHHHDDEKRASGDDEETDAKKHHGGCH